MKGFLQTLVVALAMLPAAFKRQRPLVALFGPEAVVQRCPFIGAKRTAAECRSRCATLSAKAFSKLPKSARERVMTPEEALMTILRLIDGSDEVQEERMLQILLRSIKTVAEKGLGREPE